jgi:hypothetical protein
MLPSRISAKLFIDQPTQANLDNAIPIFHDWIRDQKTDHLLIDVVDYRHVHNGPGVILIGHEGDYAIDAANGRTGLLYTNKRSRSAESYSEPQDALQNRLYKSVQALLHAAVALEQEPAFGGTLALSTQEIEITFLDRLQTPNNPKTIAILTNAVAELAAKLYRDQAVQVDAIDLGANRTPVIRLQTTESAATASELLSRLDRVPA